MEALDPAVVQFHAVKPPESRTEAEKSGQVADHLTQLAKQLSEDGRLLVWPPVAVAGYEGRGSGYVVASMPSQQESGFYR